MFNVYEPKLWLVNKENSNKRVVNHVFANIKWINGYVNNKPQPNENYIPTTPLCVYIKLIWYERKSENDGEKS